MVTGHFRPEIFQTKDTLALQQWCQSVMFRAQFHTGAELSPVMHALVIGAVRQIVTMWHHNETLTLTLKITVIYAVKDETEIKLHLVL